LGETGLTNAGVELMAQCPAVANLRSLYLGSNRIGAAGVKALVDSPHLDALRYLELIGNPFEASRTVVSSLKERFGNRLRV